MIQQFLLLRLRMALRKGQSRGGLDGFFAGKAAVALVFSPLSLLLAPPHPTYQPSWQMANLAAKAFVPVARLVRSLRHATVALASVREFAP